MRIGWPGWSVDAGDEWTVTDHLECMTLELSDRSALQFSSAHKHVGDVTDEELRSLIPEYSDDVHPAQCGEFAGLAVHYMDGETSWSRWFLRNGQTILFVTYNGTVDAKTRETEAVEALLRSLQVEEE